jgi:hypothetical protein
LAIINAQILLAHPTFARRLRIGVALAVLFAVAGCGGSAGGPSKQSPAPKDVAAKINLTPLDVPQYRAERANQIVMLQLQDGTVACVGVRTLTAGDVSVSSQQFVGKTPQTDGFIVSRVSIFPTAPDADEFITAASRNTFDSCLEKTVPTLFRSMGLSAQKETFTPKILAGNADTVGHRLYGWRMSFSMPPRTDATNTMTYFMFTRGSMLVEVDCFRAGTASRTEDTAQRLYSVLLHRADAGS